MGIDAMGKVLVRAEIENLEDHLLAKKGLIPAEKVRRVEVIDAHVVPGSMDLLLPTKMIAALGLDPVRVRPARGLGGRVMLKIYRAVRVTIQGRDCICDVGEVADDFPVIVGQVPLEVMDWVVDVNGQKLIGNPEHGGEQMMDVFCCSQR